MGWLIALAVICLLAIFPLGFRAVYRASSPGVWVLIGPIKFQIYPTSGKKDSARKEPARQSKKTASSTPEKKKKSSSDGSYKDFVPILQTIMEFLGHFRRKIRVNHLDLKVILAGGDPCDLAVNYGKAWISLGNLLPQLERIFVIKKRNLEVECEFNGDKTQIFARIDATITLGRTLHLLTRHGIKILKQLFELRKLRKGGAQI